MNRYLITLKDDNILKCSYPMVETAYRQFGDNAVSIDEIDDSDFTPYIEQVLTKAENIHEVKCGNDLRVWATLCLPIGTATVILSKDASDNRWYNIVRVKVDKKNKLVKPILYELTTPEEFCKNYFYDDVYFEIRKIKYRIRPQEIRRMIRIGSVKASEGKATVTLYTNHVDLYMVHNDFFSPVYEKTEDIGTPLGYRCEKYGIKARKEKFVYSDNWGSIVIRQCALIKIANAIPLMTSLNCVSVSKILTEMMFAYLKLNNSCVSDLIAWERFYESVAKSIVSFYVSDNQNQSKEVIT